MKFYSLGLYKDTSKTLMSCLFACSNEDCDKIISKRDVKHHESELCQFKTTTCDDCGEKMPHHKCGAHSCVL